MQSRAKLENWVTAAKADGWKELDQWKTPHDGGSACYTYGKEGFRAVVFFNKKSSLCRLKISTPNHNHYATYMTGQSDGYDWLSLLALRNVCPQCGESAELEKYSFGTYYCQPCIDKIRDFAKRNPTTPISYTGEASLEFRHIYGKRAADKVKSLRVLVNIKEGSFWEPYNGTNRKTARSIASAVQVTLKILGYKLDYQETHLTWDGEPFSPPRPEKP